jgi:ABC-type polysaccharide/polyol phosphate export permease
MSLGLPGDRRRLVRYARIAGELALSDFRLKYYDSALGYAWSMLSPLLMLAVFYAVFRFVLGVTRDDYALYLLAGIVCWSFFQDCTFSGLSALNGKAGILKAIHVPPALVVGAAALSTTITLAINAAILVGVFAGLGRIGPRAALLPLPLACLALLGAGTSFLVALAFVRYRDMGVVWHVLLSAWFWLTPVVYAVPAGPVGELFAWNPAARCLELVRACLLAEPAPGAASIAATVGFCAAVFLAGAGTFLARQALVPEKL